MTRVRILARAREEFERHLDGLPGDNPAAVPGRIERVLAAIDTLSRIEPAVDGPEVMLQDGRRLRRWATPPMVLYYRRHGSWLEVVRIRHEAQRPITR